MKKSIKNSILLAKKKLLKNKKSIIKQNKSNKSNNTNKTNKSSKKAPCQVCNPTKINLQSGLFKLKSGDTMLRNYFPKSPKITIKINFYSPDLKSISTKNTIALTGLKPNKTIFYFATNSRDFSLSQMKFADAYNNLENSGTIKTDSKGSCNVSIHCPQVYIAEDGNVYSRHLHLVYWNDKKQDWEEDIYTHQIFCNVSKEFIKKYINKKSSKVLLIDALPEDYYNKKHISNAINLPANYNWTLESVMERLPPGTHSTTPMIIYCYNQECTAAEKLYYKLNKLGFYNTMHYLGGISDWDGMMD